MAMVNLTSTLPFTPQPHLPYTGDGFLSSGQARHHHYTHRHHNHHYPSNTHNNNISLHAVSTDANSIINSDDMDGGGGGGSLLGEAYDSTVADYMHMDAFPYPGDVQHLTEPWVREPNFFPLVTVYTLAFILGVTGNALVISVLCCRRTGRCVTFPCLLSMAWADVLFLVVCVPHEIMSHVILHWGMATVSCKLSGFVEMMSALAAILNLILISIER
nr:hypothetical protein BaRGS_008525 [Batillaria attramentaria]